MRKYNVCTTKGHDTVATKSKTTIPDEVILEIGDATLDAVNANLAEVKVKKAIKKSAAPEQISEAVAADEAPAKTAKAGKRSAKAVKEAEAEVAKEERKANTDDTSESSKPTQKQSRTKLERAGKKLRDAAKLIEVGKEYSLKEALALAIKTATTKFDSSVELHINLGVDPKHADQNIRDNFMLPSGTGKTIRVAVFADVDDLAKALKSGADLADNDQLMKDLDKGVANFDVLISTPMMMAKLGKYARILGPKGLMPNPKSGTVTTDVAKAVTESKAGKVEYRVDSTGIVHIAVGKVSFGVDKLLPNVQAVFASVKGAKPASVKGNYLKSIYMTTTMGPSIRIQNTEL